MYGFIVEVERAANYALQPIPIIAILDISSPIDWISQSFVDELEKALLKPSKIVRRGAHPEVNGVAGCVLLEWSCKALGCMAEPRIFFVAPHAKFKVIFGSESKTPRILKTAQCTCYVESLGQISTQSVCSREKGPDFFYWGIQHGILIQLKQLSRDKEHSNSDISVEELEAWLKHVTGTSLQTKKLPHSSRDNDEAREYRFDLNGILSSTRFLMDGFTLDEASISDNDSIKVPRLLEVNSNSGQEGQVNSLSRKSCWSIFYAPSLTTPEQPFAIEEWVNQPVGAELNLSKSTHLQRVPDPRQEIRRIKGVKVGGLTAAEIADQERLIRGYWEWDAKKKNYKHLDIQTGKINWYDSPHRKEKVSRLRFSNKHK